MSNEKELEMKLQALGLDAPRLNPGAVNKVIRDVQFHVFPGTTTTVCCITLANGFNVTGTSASASPENFNESIGRQVAYDNARNCIWELEGYLLKQSLFLAESGLGTDE